MLREGLQGVFGEAIVHLPLRSRKQSNFLSQGELQGIIAELQASLDEELAVIAVAAVGVGEDAIGGGVVPDDPRFHKLGPKTAPEPRATTAASPPKSQRRNVRREAGWGRPSPVPSTAPSPRATVSERRTRSRSEALGRNALRPATNKAATSGLESLISLPRSLCRAVP